MHAGVAIGCDSDVVAGTSTIVAQWVGMSLRTIVIIMPGIELNMEGVYFKRPVMRTDTAGTSAGNAVAEAASTKGRANNALELFNGVDLEDTHRKAVTTGILTTAGSDPKTEINVARGDLRCCIEIGTT